MFLIINEDCVASQAVNCVSATSTMATPKARGFHVPAEWEEHSACLIGWTCRKGLWPEEGKLVQRVIMNVIRAISKYEKVLVVAREGGFVF